MRYRLVGPIIVVMKQDFNCLELIVVEGLIFLATIDSNTTSYTDENLEAETAYYYRILANGQYGSSEPSNNTFATTSSLPSVPIDTLYRVSLNFSNNYNVSSPWNNTSKTPASGNKFSNLKNQNGDGSGVDVTLLTNFGVYNEGAQTGNNTGVIPDNALKEYYYFGIFGTPNQAQLKISGLENANTYSIKFVGSSVWGGVPDNGETNYTIGNKTVSLDVQANTQNAAEITNIKTNSNGEIIVSMTKGTGASVGYINAMILEAYGGGSQSSNPTDLQTKATSESTIELTWNDNSFDEQGFEIYRLDNGNNYTLIHTTNADENSYTNTGLSSGTSYSYKVRSITANGYSEYSNVAIGATVAYRVFVNINGEPAYNQSAPWNNLNSLGLTGEVFTGFKNNNGNASGIAMEVLNEMTGSNDWGTTTGNDSGIYPDKVMKSFYFNNSFKPKGEFVLKGLDFSYHYNIKFFGAIATDFNIETNFTVGNTTVTNRQRNNTTDAVSIYGIVPDDNGEIKFEVQEAPGSRWAIFNAFVIEAYPVASPNARSTQVKSKPIAGTHVVQYGDLSSGLNEASKEVVVSYYPNPITTSLTIEIDNVVSGVGGLTLSDSKGQVIVEKELSLNKGYNSLTLEDEVSSLVSGLYIITIQTNGEVQYLKTIVP